MTEFRGVVIAEGLDDPTVINELSVYKAEITKDGMAIDYEGHFGRWHAYYVRCSKDDINQVQSHMRKGWYAHFWKGDKIIVVFNDLQFELARDDRSTWRDAVAHGISQGIPRDELDFSTD